MPKKLAVSTTGAWGHTTKSGMKQCAVRLPEAIWDEVKARAVKSGTSIQAVIQDYVQVGVEVDKDWDTDEPDRYEKTK